jgi:hypothetical protein
MGGGFQINPASPLRSGMSEIYVVLYTEKMLGFNVWPITPFIVWQCRSGAASMALLRLSKITLLKSENLSYAFLTHFRFPFFKETVA